MSPTPLICHCGQPMRARTFSEVFPTIPRGNQIMETVTCVGYTSPEGHCHDDNCVTRDYICPAGHTLKVGLRRTCPACNWKGKEKCSCHPGTKVDQWPESVETTKPRQ